MTEFEYTQRFSLVLMSKPTFQDTILTMLLCGIPTMSTLDTTESESTVVSLAQTQTSLRHLQVLHTCTLHMFDLSINSCMQLVIPDAISRMHSISPKDFDPPQEDLVLIEVE
jgi:hypothetical protein